MTFSLRPATLADVDAVLPRTRALNDHEGIEIDDASLQLALRRLLGDPNLGGVWLILDDERVIGHAVVTFGFDLEHAGRDAYLTELWIDRDARGRGAASAALALLEPELDALDVHALHLQVRPDNPAVRLYERAGFTRSPRVVMTRELRRRVIDR